MQSRVEVSDSAFDFVRPNGNHQNLDEEERHFDCDEVFTCGLVLSQEDVDDEKSFVNDEEVHFLSEDVHKSE